MLVKTLLRRLPQTVRGLLISRFLPIPITKSSIPTVYEIRLTRDKSLTASRTLRSTWLIRLDVLRGRKSNQTSGNDRLTRRFAPRSTN